MWFEKLTGFSEISHENVHKNLFIEENKLFSAVNNRSFQFGELELISLSELRKNVIQNKTDKKIQVSEIVGDVQDLHCDLENENALFQAASQFNLLEMVGPDIIPEFGVDIYENDFTQGPACAIACGAGTIYRNYFVPIKEHLGQTKINQIDCLIDIAKELENEKRQLWDMKNGYALVNQAGLLALNKQLSSFTDQKREHLKGLLKIGIQWNTEVTISEHSSIVSQIYCSALPVAYSHIDSIYWEYFARIILEATYEATLYAAMVNMEKYKSNKVFLTLVGGGAFGNENHWIIESILKALEKFENVPLDVKIVSYGVSNSLLNEIIQKYN